jgi:hypothetical protein
VLVSEAGFTKSAKTKAEAKGAVTIAPRDLEGDHRARDLIQKLSEFTLREVRAEITHVAMFVLRPNGKRMRVKEVPLNVNLYTEDGEYLTMLIHLIEAENHANAADLGRFHSQLATNADQEYVMTLAPTLDEPVWNLPAGLTLSRIYAHWTDVEPHELQVIEKFELTTRAVVRDVPTVEMTTRQLDNVAYSYGATTLGGKKALIVITADESGGKITIRQHGSRGRT